MYGSIITGIRESAQSDAYLCLQASHLGSKVAAGLFSLLGLQPGLLQFTAQPLGFSPQLLVFLLQLLQAPQLLLKFLVLLLLGIVMGLGFLHLCGQMGWVAVGEGMREGRVAWGWAPHLQLVVLSCLLLLAQLRLQLTQLGLEALGLLLALTALGLESMRKADGDGWSGSSTQIHCLALAS